MQLGFLHFEVRDPERWAAFLTGVLGLQDAGGGRYRMDGHAWRFQITGGPADDLVAVGWELADDELSGLLVRIADLEPREADAAERGAQRRYLLTDPAGTPIELVSGLERADTPFESEQVPGGFVADELGLGHLVVAAPDKAKSRAFYERLGFVLSDHIVTEVYGFPVDLSFFHCNGRHHSLAFGGPLEKRLHHFMVEARDVDQVGRAYDRAIRGGVRIMQTLGRHPNDRMLSFYARTPSRFEFEFGWGGRIVDDATWEPTTYDRISDWGHHPPQVVFAKPKRKA